MSTPTPFARADLSDFAAYEVKNIPYKIKLDANESPFDLPDPLKKTLAEELMSIPLNRYPDASGSKLKKRLAQDLGVNPNQISIGNGSDELISYIISAFGGGGNYARLIFPKPTFVMYEVIAKVCSVESQAVPLDGNFDISAEAIIERCALGGSNLIFLSYPNNPTANCFSETEVIKLLQTQKALVVMDEAYFEFSRKSFLPLLNSYDNLIILRTFSKAFSLAALRVGYAISSSELISQIEKVRLPYNVNAFSQTAAVKLLENASLIIAQAELILKERERMAKGLSKLNEITLYKSDANFILFRASNSDGIYQKLLEKGILIKNLNKPGPLKSCLRVSVGKPEENEAFIAAVKEAIGDGQ